MVQGVLTFPAQSGRLPLQPGMTNSPSPSHQKIASKEETAEAMNNTTFSILRVILASSCLSETIWETIAEAVSPKGQSSGPACSVGADAPGGAPLQAEQGSSVKMHMSLSWEKKPRRPACSDGTGKGERGKGELLTNHLCPGAGPGQPLPPVLSCMALLDAPGLRAALLPQQRDITGAGRAARPSHGEDSAPAIPHLRAVKMPLWESKRKIKGRPEQGIALSEVTTFIVTFVLHRLVHHRGFFIPFFFFLVMFFHLL